MKDSPRHPDSERPAPSRRDFEPPKLERLGRVQDLTRGAGINTSDGAFGS